MEAELDGVAETSLWTLRNRAVEAMRPDTRYPDPWAVRLFEALPYDYDRFGKPSQSHPLRAAALDRATRAYLDSHPKATVVALGEGLQTTYWRLDRPPVPWLSVDLAPVQELRARLLPAEPHVRALPGSALDRSWLDEVDPSHGVFISAEGLFMYFDEADVLALIADSAARFPGGQLFFDSIPPWFSTRTLKGMQLTERYTAPPMPFGLPLRDALRLPQRIPAVAGAVEAKLPPGRGLWGSRLATGLSDRPPLRNVRPNIVVLTFAGA